jgi:hypothetical protein
LTGVCARELAEEAAGDEVPRRVRASFLEGPAGPCIDTPGAVDVSVRVSLARRRR